MNQFKRIAAALLSGVLLCGALPASTVVWAVGNDSILQDNQTSYAVGDTFDDGVLTYTITGAATVSVTDCTLGASWPCQFQSGASSPCVSDVWWKCQHASLAWSR